jgi:hypothetical protein
MHSLRRRRRMCRMGGMEARDECASFCVGFCVGLSERDFANVAMIAFGVLGRFGALQMLRYPVALLK